ncbi:MAG: preprotein translocase subunit SecE [Clostridiales bacterium]|jgi:preprotein translocase subunit SecE|nr:preprotein translocase subunit SecE [Clostridiales bacterium]
MAKAKENAVKRTTDPVKKTDKNAKKSFKERVSQWFRDLKSELKKVVWPTRKQLVNNTAVALVVILLSALVLWGFDSLAQAGAKALIDLV